MNVMKAGLGQLVYIIQIRREELERDVYIYI